MLSRYTLSFCKDVWTQRGCTMWMTQKSMSASPHSLNKQQCTSSSAKKQMSCCKIRSHAVYIHIVVLQTFCEDVWTQRACTMWITRLCLHRHIQRAASLSKKQKSCWKIRSQNTHVVFELGFFYNILMLSYSSPSTCYLQLPLLL